jgi:hypothetical protein
MTRGYVDSLVNYSGARLRFSREWLVGPCTVMVHRTLSGGTPDSPVPRPQHTQFFAPVQFSP